MPLKVCPCGRYKCYVHPSGKTNDSFEDINGKKHPRLIEYPAPSRATDLTARTTGYIAILNTIFSQVMSWFAVKYTLKIPPEKQVQPIVVNRGLRTRLPNGSLHKETPHLRS